MGLQENIATTIRTIMERENKSLTEFSEELEISRSALFDYVKARGNPSVATIERIADKLGINPAVLITGLFDQDHRESLLMILDTVHGLSDLTEEKRLRFAELIMEMVKLWTED